MNDNGAAAVAVAKEKATHQTVREIVMANGVRVVVTPVAATLIDEVTSRVKRPRPPLVHMEDKGRDEPNFSDPDYLDALEQSNRDRSNAGMDALILFGVDLPDGLPEDDKWVSKLKLMEKMGKLDLAAFDLDDEIEREFLYKRYVLADKELIDAISAVSGLSEEEIKEAEESFRS